MKKQNGGFTLIEVVLAMQVIAIVMTLFVMSYLYLVNHWNHSKSLERELSYERFFLNNISYNIQNAVSASVQDNNLFLLYDDGSGLRYNYKLDEQRVDIGTKAANQSMYYGRITGGVNLEFVFFSTNEDTVTIRYRIGESEDKVRTYRLR